MLKNNSQGGAVPILLLVAALGLLVFLFVTNTFDFKDKLFNKLFPKPPSHAQEVSPTVPDEILLKFKPGVDEEAKDHIRNSHGIKVEEVIDKIDVERGKVPAEAKDKIIEALKKNPQVEFAEPNFIVQAQLSPNDTYYTIGRQWAPTKINAPSAWDITTGASSAVIAILDSGVNYNHEDLFGKFIGTPDLDDNGHGTWVAGIAGAIGNNGKGVAGICWLCPMLSIKILDSTGSGSVSGSASAIVSAANQGVKIINMSYGSSGISSTEQAAVNYAWDKGVVLVAAAGNYNTSTPFYPAAHDNVVAVGGTDSSDKLFALSTNPNYASNYGPWIDVVAPGAAIYTTSMGGGYEAQTGTSFASPHVAGLAGLILSANPALTNQQVVDIITSTALDLGTTGKDDLYGYGRIDAAAALQKAIGTTPAPTPTATPIPSPTPTPALSPTPTPSDTTPPTVSITNPANNSIVKVNSTVNITVSASDNVSVSKVEFYVNSSLKCTSAVTPYTCSWKVPGKKNTVYILTAKAYDASGNTGTSLTIKLTAQ